MRLTLFILAAVTLGVICGFMLTGVLEPQYLDSTITMVLGVVLFGVGVDLGSNHNAWKQLLSLGVRVLVIPLTIAVMSLLSCAVCGLTMNLTLTEGLAIGAGFGWYSLSAGLISQLHSPMLGALALLTNIFREVLAIVSIPAIAKYLGDLAAIAPGGATSMDTSLPIIAKATAGRATPIAFINGAVLSALVPLLIPLILG